MTAGWDNPLCQEKTVTAPLRLSTVLYKGESCAVRLLSLQALDTWPALLKPLEGDSKKRWSTYGT